jgi:hypothetical protein
MKLTAILLFVALVSVSALAEDTTKVTAVVTNRPLEFSPELRTQVVEKSVALLSSCGYMNAKPKWGAAPTEPKSIEDAQKDSHLRLVFSTPRKVKVPGEKITVHVREMVISLPLVIAGIWVRTDEGVVYFAMFGHEPYEELRALLKKAMQHE